MSESKARSKDTKYEPVPNIRRSEASRDPHMYILSREQRVREKMIAVEETKLIGAKLRKCYLEAGVDHYTVCEQLAREYARRVSTPGYGAAPVELSDIPKQ